MNDTPTSPPPDEPAAPSTLHDLALRIGHTVLGRSARPVAPETGPSGTAVQTLAMLAIARLGTRSLRGATLVSAGLIAKALYDRSQTRRRAHVQGDTELAERAKD